MPRSSTAISLDIKPYDRPASSTPAPSSADDIKPRFSSPAAGPTKTKTKPKTKKQKADRKSRDNTSTPSRAWTTEELVQLFDHVAKNGASGGKAVWEGAVAGRSANQAYQTWLQSLAPYIRRAIASKPGRGKA